jgi:hypothetical protein
MPEPFQCGAVDPSPRMQSLRRFLSGAAKLAKKDDYGILF